MKELKQLVERSCWVPTMVEDLTPMKKKRVVDAMMLLAKKNEGTIKGRYVFKRSETRDCLTKTSAQQASRCTKHLLTKQVLATD